LPLPPFASPLHDYADDAAAAADFFDIFAVSPTFFHISPIIATPISIFTPFFDCITPMAFAMPPLSPPSLICRCHCFLSLSFLAAFDCCHADDFSPRICDTTFSLPMLLPLSPDTSALPPGCFRSFACTQQHLLIFARALPRAPPCASERRDIDFRRFLHTFSPPTFLRFLSLIFAAAILRHFLRLSISPPHLRHLLFRCRRFADTLICRASCRFAEAAAYGYAAADDRSTARFRCYAMADAR
jgi:hypothetical protein